MNERSGLMFVGYAGEDILIALERWGNSVDPCSCLTNCAEIFRKAADEIKMLRAHIIAEAKAGS